MGWLSRLNQNNWKKSGWAVYELGQINGWKDAKVLFFVRQEIASYGGSIIGNRCSVITLFSFLLLSYKKIGVSNLYWNQIQSQNELKYCFCALRNRWIATDNRCSSNQWLYISYCNESKRHSPGLVLASDVVPKSKRHETITKDNKAKNEEIRMTILKFMLWNRKG